MMHQYVHEQMQQAQQAMGGAAQTASPQLYHQYAHDHLWNYCQCTSP